MIPLPGGLLFKGIIALALVAAIAFALWRLHASIYASGYEAGQREYRDAQEEKTTEVIREVERIVIDVQEKVVYRDRVIKEKADVIVERIPVFITQADDRACELRAGSVRLHDAAATNNPPESPAESDRDPAGIDLSETMRTVSKNYAAFHSCRAQVIGWNEWWTRYSEALRGAVCMPK